MRKLRGMGIKVWTFDSLTQRVPFSDFRKKCVEERIAGVLVEGGAQLISELVRSRQLDYLFAYHAPILLADDKAKTIFSGMRPEKIEHAVAQHPSASFVALVVARATPLPDAPLKLAAAAANYPVPLYCAAILLGSVPYYFALALVGHALKLPTWLVFGAAALIVIGILVDRIRRDSKART